MSANGRWFSSHILLLSGEGKPSRPGVPGPYVPKIRPQMPMSKKAGAAVDAQRAAGGTS